MTQETCIPIPALPNQFAMDLQYLLDKNFIAKSIPAEAVFSSSILIFFACSWLIVTRLWAFQRLMHVVDQLISNFNSSSSFGGIYVFGNQRCNFERLKDCHTDHRNFHDCCIVTITLVKSLCWIWQAYLIQWSATLLQSSTEQRVRKFPFKYLWPAIRSFIKLSNSSFFTDLLIEISSS